jgi:hypothetical protein
LAKKTKNKTTTLQSVALFSKSRHKFHISYQNSKCFCFFILSGVSRHCLPSSLDQVVPQHGRQQRSHLQQPALQVSLDRSFIHEWLTLTINKKISQSLAKANANV